MPAVSVVVPVYNAVATLAETVESVLRQTLTDWELLLVDDGSTDESGALCRSFSDPRITVLHQANRGLAGARNAGIRAATAPYVALLDADDVWHPDKLARHVAHLDAHPRVGLSFSQSLLVDTQTRSLGKVQGAPGGPVSAETLVLDNPVGNGSSPVLRRAALDAIAEVDERGEPMYFDEAQRAIEDLDCWWRLALTTPYTVASVPEVLTYYRQHAGAMSLNHERMRRYWDRAFEKALRYAPEQVGPLHRPARARMLRYLAGRAVAARDGRAALRLLREALATDRSLLRTRPRAVALTAAAALALRLVPSAWVGRAERLIRPRDAGALPLSALRRTHAP